MCVFLLFFVIIILLLLLICFRCARYDHLRSGCALETDPHDSCCKVPVCAPQQMSTRSPHTPLPGSTNHPIPNATPGNPVNPTPSVTLIPSPVPTGVIVGIGPKPTNSARRFHNFDFIKIIEI